MPVKVQGDNGKNGVGVFGSTCRGFFRVFDLHHYVRGSTPRLATIRLRPLSITKTIRGACPLAYCRQEKMDGIEEKVKRIAAVVDSRPLKVLLISDIEQISLRKPLINLQVFLSL